jgi:hypothetical protein
MNWLKKMFGDSINETEQFRNSGDTKREREVARLLNGLLPAPIVETIRFCEQSGMGLAPDEVAVYIDLAGGNAIKGGYVKKSMTAKQQAEKILRSINASLSL